jgi:hypothetical protein
MSVLQVTLSETNSRRVNELSRTTGKTPEQLVNDALAQFASETEAEEQQKFQEWRQAMLRVAGIWSERDDLPDFDDIRRSMDRDPYTKA